MHGSRDNFCMITAGDEAAAPPTPPVIKQFWSS
jgi:hypothetical protein